MPIHIKIDECTYIFRLQVRAQFNNFSYAPELPRFKLAPVPTTNLRLIPAETLRKKDQPISRRHSFKFVKRGFLTRNLYMSKQIYNKNSSLFLKGNCMFNISAFVYLKILLQQESIYVIEVWSNIFKEDNFHANMKRNIPGNCNWWILRP